MAELRALEDAFNSLFSTMEAEALSLGASIAVDYDEAFCKDNNINRRGRMEVDGPNTTYYAGPSIIQEADRKLEPLIFERFSEFPDKYIKKESVAGWGEYITREIPFRQEKVKPVNRMSRCYESKLVRAIGSPLVVVNPSKSSMYNLQGDFFVYLSSIDPDYLTSMHSVCKSLGKRIVKRSEIEDDWVGYHGLNGISYSPCRRSFGLVPNPIFLEEMFKRSGYVFSERGCVLDYNKSGRDIKTMIPVEGDFMLSPRQVDRWLDLSDRFFFCSFYNMTIDVVGPDDVGAGHRYYLPPFPDYNGGYCEDNEVVYDVPLGGTYCGRRSAIRRYAALKGKKPVSFVMYSESYVTLYDSKVVKESIVRVNEGKCFLVPTHRARFLSSYVTAFDMVVSHVTKGVIFIKGDFTGSMLAGNAFGSYHIISLIGENVLMPVLPLVSLDKLSWVFFSYGEMMERFVWLLEQMLNCDKLVAPVTGVHFEIPLFDVRDHLTVQAKELSTICAAVNKPKAVVGRVLRETWGVGMYRTGGREFFYLVDNLPCQSWLSALMMATFSTASTVRITLTNPMSHDLVEALERLGVVVNSPMSGPTAICKYVMWRRRGNVSAIIDLGCYDNG